MERRSTSLRARNAGLTLSVTNATSLGSLAAVTLTNTNTNIAALSLGVATETIGSLSGNGTVTDSIASVLTIGSGNSSGGGLSTTFTGILGTGTGALGITKAGDGTLTLTPATANTYTGATTVSAGVLKLGNAFALGATSGVTVNGTGVLDLNGQTITNAQTWTVGGVGQSGSGALINSSTTTATLNINQLNVSPASLGGSGNIVVNTTLGLGSNQLLNKIGTGTLTIIDTTTSQTRSSANEIDGGVLRLQSALGTIAPVGTGAFILNGGTPEPGL